MKRSGVFGLGVLLISAIRSDRESLIPVVDGACVRELWLTCTFRLMFTLRLMSTLRLMVTLRLTTDCRQRPPFQLP